MVASLFVVRFLKVLTFTVSLLLVNLIQNCCILQWHWLGSFFQVPIFPHHEFTLALPLPMGKWMSLSDLGVSLDNGLACWFDLLPLVLKALDQYLTVIFFFSGYSFLFVFMKWLSKRNWLTTHFGHGDLHPLSCLGLQQADTRPLSTNFYVIQKMSFLKTMYLSQIVIGWYSICCCLFWAVRMDLTSSLTAPKGLNFFKNLSSKIENSLFFANNVRVDYFLLLHCS